MAARARTPFSIAILSLVLAVLAAAPAQAQLVDAYAARAVPVDATAETAAAARVKAIAEAQRRGLRLVFERLVLAEDWPRLPRLNDRAIEPLVLGIEVDKERTSAVRYLAELTIRFKAAEMRELLRQAGVRFAETMSRPVVVLPVLIAAKGTEQTAILWSEENPWRLAWADQPTGLGLVPLIVPIGDLSDADLIDAEAALAGDQAKLGLIAQRYRAAEAIVAVLKRTEDARGRNLVLQPSLARYALGGAAAEGTAPEAFPEARPVTVPATANLDERLAAIARDQGRAIEEQWKRAHVLRFGQEQLLGMSLPLSSLQDLVEARRRLSDVSGVRRVEVTAITRKRARLSVAYAGDPEQLRQAAAQKDLVLAPSPPDWELTLATPSLAPPSPATAAPGAAQVAPAPGTVARPQ